MRVLIEAEKTRLQWKWNKLAIENWLFGVFKAFHICKLTKLNPTQAMRLTCNDH